MIIGDCPYDDCGHVAGRALPRDRSLPAYSRETCEGCHRIVWVKYTRIDPVVYTEADFIADFIIDDEKRTVVPRNPPPPQSPIEMEIAKRIAEKIADQMLAETLTGKRP